MLLGVSGTVCGCNCASRGGSRKFQDLNFPHPMGFEKFRSWNSREPPQEAQLQPHTARERPITRYTVQCEEKFERENFELDLAQPMYVCNRLTSYKIILV